MDSVDVKNLDVPKSTLTEQDLERLREGDRVRFWPKTPFPIDEEINKRVVLYDGDLELLQADAVVNPTNENLTQLEPMDKLAGPELDAYIKKKGMACATGDVRVTPGFRSNFKHIIHAVPPKYQPKYKTAAETALFHTYFRILETMIEKKIRSVVMPALATTKSNLPIEDNCSLQLRTIRRMLEKKLQEFDKIVIYVPLNGEHYNLPFFCYFPRTPIDEGIACYKFDQTIGGSNGEPVIPEREIRIKSMPATLDCHDRSIDLRTGLDLSTVVGKNPFSQMQDDVDKIRFNSNGACNDSRVVIRRSLFRGCNLL